MGTPETSVMEVVNVRAIVEEVLRNGVKITPGGVRSSNSPANSSAPISGAKAGDATLFG